MTRPHIVACSVFGGYSKRTGKAVGQRHRWPNGWGIGWCEFCGRSLDQVRLKLERKGQR